MSSVKKPAREHTVVPQPPKWVRRAWARPEEFVNDEHYRPAGKREEQNGEINSKYS
jgi:hypothetical protein